MARNNGKRNDGDNNGKRDKRDRGDDRASTEPAPVDLRVQLPYFAVRIAVLLVALAVLLILDVNPILAVLSGLVIAGVLTYPLGRMQRRAADRAADRATDRSPERPSGRPE